MSIQLFTMIVWLGGTHVHLSKETSSFVGSASPLEAAIAISPVYLLH